MRSITTFIITLFITFYPINFVFSEPEDNTIIWDPLEKVNRGVFAFNDFIDLILLEPIAKGYDYVVPDTVQKSVRLFFQNLAYPSHLVSDLLQGKFSQAAVHSGRFAINSTLGVGGLFDVAEDFGLKYHEEDFGTALGYYDIPAGPYIVLPILGPSNLRDGIGRVVDSFLDPTTFVAYSNVSSSTQNSIIFGLNGIRIINIRSSMLETIDSAKEASMDYYLFIQSSYSQYREGLIWDKGNEPTDQLNPNKDILEEETDFLPEDEFN
jgi:phospholipid-binding lipoprotein MlaA